MSMKLALEHIWARVGCSYGAGYEAHVGSGWMLIWARVESSYGAGFGAHMELDLKLGLKHIWGWI